MSDCYFYYLTAFGHAENSQFGPVWETYVPSEHCLTSCVHTLRFASFFTSGHAANLQVGATRET